MKTQKPVNQKTIYHSYADLFEKIMNDEIPLDKAERAEKALAGMNQTYALELKRAALENELKIKSEQIKIRTIELKNFDEIPLPDATDNPK
jgi:hypothetical protein